MVIKAVIYSLVPMPFHCPDFDCLQYRITESRNTSSLLKRMPNYFIFSSSYQATVCVLVLLGYSHIANLACAARRNYICTVLQNMFSYFALLSVEPCLSSLLLSVFYHCVTCSGGLNPVTIAIRLMSRETLNSQVSQECYGPGSLARI